jgi:hypothetical protein
VEWEWEWEWGRTRARAGMRNADNADTTNSYALSDLNLKVTMWDKEKRSDEVLRYLRVRVRVRSSSELS